MRLKVFFSEPFYLCYLIFTLNCIAFVENPLYRFVRFTRVPSVIIKLLFILKKWKLLGTKCYRFEINWFYLGSFRD